MVTKIKFMKTAICLIIKNDQSYLQEWLQHHREIGIDHFYIYDNESDPKYENLGDDVTIIDWDENMYFQSYEPVINPLYYKENELKHFELLELKYKFWPALPHRNLRQHKAYQHCLNNYGSENDWIAFIDCDEFITLAEGEDFKSLMSEFNNFGQLLLCWRTFGTSGHLTKQPLQKEAYTEWYPDLWSKCVVQPSRAYAIDNVHKFIIYPQFLTVYENKQNHKPYMEHYSERIWINHYWSRSMEDFEETKINRKGGVTQKSDETYYQKLAEVEKLCRYFANKRNKNDNRTTK